jgi:hypothetical protein
VRSTAASGYYKEDGSIVVGWGDWLGQVLIHLDVVFHSDYLFGSKSQVTTFFFMLWK